MAVGPCGDAIEVSLRIDRGAIADIKVVPHGYLKQNREQEPWCASL
jgi:hypothetical protein